ncbi:putative arrestin-like protein [Rosellinia necatrix]|uniref:Putative arrestin-like protein n=1 Tax=Rosellinia necatrix TaxID=77044 RepID=A0A1S7UJ47_ROSNE|nr:putative arrestin-like protein [Rosellinia necatrix]
MSIRIALDKPPEFYTNLDFISGRVIILLNRPETVGNIIVKLEGESRTALSIQPERREEFTTPGNSVSENHKILYRLFQVYPDDAVALSLQPGQHEFKFNFKVPLNNICHDARAMGAIMGVGGVGGANNAGVMGKGFRTMDGTKQLMLAHIKSTLPPSLTGFPQEAEIRYYIKVTIQRPGIFKENWRYQLGFKFLPIEPPRPDAQNREAFARRPFAFKPRTPLSGRKSFFGSKPTNGLGGMGQTPPSIEMSARLPFPSILTCNEPIPLRLIARKLLPTQEQVHLTALEIALVGYTHVRVANLEKTERTRWIVMSAVNLSIALGKPTDPVDTEFELPNTLWAARRLPNTIAPSFRTCNLMRRYEFEMRLSLSWGLPNSRQTTGLLPQILSLPLTMSKIEVFSGIKPPAQLLQTAAAAATATTPSTGAGGRIPSNINGNSPIPRPPPRPSANGGPSMPPRPSDPLYPPQLGPDNVPSYEDAPPPSYDEAMAESLAGPLDRPAYSGVTAENAPSTMPAEKAMR